MTVTSTGAFFRCLRGDEAAETPANDHHSMHTLRLTRGLKDFFHGAQDLIGRGEPFEAVTTWPLRSKTTVTGS